MAEKKRNVLNKIVLFTLIGLVPGLFLYIFSKGKQEFHVPGYFGLTIDNNGDTVYHTIPNFSFTTLHGETQTLNDYKDKIVIAIVLGSSCPDDCEIHVDGFAQILMDEIGGNSNYDDVVVMVDFLNYDEREKPTFDLLDPYFKSGHWTDNIVFFQSKLNELYNFKVLPNTPHLLNKTIAGYRNGKAYYNFALVIDKNRKIRGIHNIKSSSDHVRDLVEDIKILKKEEDYAKTS